MDERRAREACRRPEPVRRVAGPDWRVELLPAQPYDVRYVAETDGIGFAFDSQCGDHAFGGDRPRAFETPPDSLAFVPRGCEVMSRSARGGEYLVVHLGAPLAATPAVRFNDRIAETAIGAAHRLRLACLSGAPDPLAVEESVCELAAAAGRIAGRPGEADGAARWMTPQRLRRIEELIEARLDETLTVARLAAELDLSPSFFIRAFRAATGRTPHERILDRRIARARAELVEGSDSLAQIALDCGFASHAHMSAAFRRRLGASPDDLRRDAIGSPRRPSGARIPPNGS